MEEDRVALACGTFLLAGMMALLGFWLASDRRRQLLRAAETTNTNVTDTDEKKQSEQREVNQPSASCISKRQAKSKKRREAQQEFSHSWMVGSLKGHTAPVLDMDFSANGKFLASCAEDRELAPPHEDEERAAVADAVTAATSAVAAAEAAPAAISARGTRNARSGTGKSKSATPTPSSAPPSPSSSTKSSSSTASGSEQQRAILSRRQRKNRMRVPREQRRELRTRDAPCEDERNRPTHATTAGPIADGTSAVSVVAVAAATPTHPCPWTAVALTSSSSFSQLHRLGDAALAGFLRSYALGGEQLAQLGYPIELDHFPGHAVILSYQQQPAQQLDANAREFVPGDVGSAGSSLESSDLEQESASDSDKGSETGERAGAIERRCARCTRPFYVGREDGEYLREEKCCYHWGKQRGVFWECCRGRENSRGCASAKAHVWTGLVPGFNGPFVDYARTRPARQMPRDGNYGVYALDCEMCFTKRGLELGKVTVVALDGRLVYEALVKPDTEVIDYNTRFSGLRPRDLAKATKSLRHVQKDITGFIFAETILIGHGLENDLRALRILHSTVVDTCVAFPHFLGYPFRNSLKTLARTVLHREIQVKEHDSAEDARIAVDLMLTRLQHDFF